MAWWDKSGKNPIKAGLCLISGFFLGILLLAPLSWALPEEESALTELPSSIIKNAPCINSATATALGPTTFCSGSSVDITASADNGRGPFAYLWSPNGETTQTITATTSGTYTCEVTDTDGTCGNSEVTNVVLVTADPGVRSIFWPRSSASVKYLNNDDIPDVKPDIHDGQVVWSRNYGIAVWDGVSTTQITNNGMSPQTHNGQVAWVGSDGSSNQVYFWDGISITQLSSGTASKFNTRIHNGMVVWYEFYTNPFITQDVYFGMAFQPSC